MEEIVMLNMSLTEFKRTVQEAVKEALTEIEERSRVRIDNQRMVNLKTLCELYNWKRATVYQWIHQSLIPNSKVGKFVYFNVAEVDAWLASGRRKTMTEIEEEAQRYIQNSSHGRRRRH